MTGHDEKPTSRDATKHQRIAKAMARTGLCSRRDAEAWVLEGRVSVNGEVLTSPALDVGPEDTILVDGVAMPTAEKTRLFLFHKPRGLVTSDHDPEGRETVADFLRENWPEGPRVVTVGRLDINTEGLLLLTNDGGLARVLELPQTGWLRRYRVRAKGSANPASLDALAAGVTIDGIDYAGIEAKLDRVQGANCWLTMGLREGKNREIKRVLEHVGLEVNRLIRLSFGPFQLLDLPEGAVEEVRTRVLRDQLGESLAKQAGVTFESAEPLDPPSRERRPPLAEKAESSPTERNTASQQRRPLRPDDKRRMPPLGRTPRRSPDGDRGNRDDAATPKRERPVAGSRKHVSILRATKAETSRTGPRTRIEHVETRDRRDRTIKVERRVPTRSPAERPRPRGTDQADGRPSVKDRSKPRDRGTSRQHQSKGRRGETDAPVRRDRHAGPSPERRHASPSALGKRERRSRSGETSDRFQDRQPNADKKARSSEPRGRDRRETRTEQRPARGGGQSSHKGAKPPQTSRGTTPRSGDKTRVPGKRPPPRNAPSGGRPPRGPSKPRR